MACDDIANGRRLASWLEGVGADIEVDDGIISNSGGEPRLHPRSRLELGDDIIESSTRQILRGPLDLVSLGLLELLLGVLNVNGFGRGDVAVSLFEVLEAAGRVEHEVDASLGILLVLLALRCHEPAGVARSEVDVFGAENLLVAVMNADGRGLIDEPVRVIVHSLIEGERGWGVDCFSDSTPEQLVLSVWETGDGGSGSRESDGDLGGLSSIETGEGQNEQSNDHPHRF